MIRVFLPFVLLLSAAPVAADQTARGVWSSDRIILRSSPETHLARAEAMAKVRGASGFTSQYLTAPDFSVGRLEFDDDGLCLGLRSRSGKCRVYAQKNGISLRLSNTQTRLPMQVKLALTK